MIGSLISDAIEGADVMVYAVSLSCEYRCDLRAIVDARSASFEWFVLTDRCGYT